MYEVFKQLMCGNSNFLFAKNLETCHKDRVAFLCICNDGFTLSYLGNYWKYEITVINRKKFTDFNITFKTNIDILWRHLLHLVFVTK